MIHGKYDVELVRDGEVIDSFSMGNLLTDELVHQWLLKIQNGTNPLLYFGFMLLIDNSGFSAISTGDTYVGINNTNGWMEFESYNNHFGFPSRAIPLFELSDADSLTVHPDLNRGAIFRITGTATLAGVGVVMGDDSDTFIQGDNSLNTGVLVSAAEFPTTLSVASGDVLFIRYTLSVS